MGEELHHYCGIAMVRLLKPVEYYIKKYNTPFYGLNLLYPLMEKQRNRGQDGAGIASIKLEVDPGHGYLDIQRSVFRDPISDAMEQCKDEAQKALAKLPYELQQSSRILKHCVPFTGECFLGHVRYGTDSENCYNKCHPVSNVNNWPTRSLVLAGNFNLTNVDELFEELISYGQHPREKSDTITLVEDLSYLLDLENRDLYAKFYAQGYNVPTCFQLIAEKINVLNILRHAAKRWDGGYCICGMLGHGDMFAIRDPCGIRPCFYYISEEVCVIASEKPVIQSVCHAVSVEVKELQPGHAILIRRDGSIAIERVVSFMPEAKCSFERIYFSRGGDGCIYQERLKLGEILAESVLKACDYKVADMLLSYVPNTSEIAFLGLIKGLQSYLLKHRQNIDPNTKAIPDSNFRIEKILTKDSKIRTFIQEDRSRDHLISLAYDISYDTVRPQDLLVMVDDSIVRGSTMKNSILLNLQKLAPKKIVFVSSAPQIRYPDCYGIDISIFGDLIAFRAAVSLIKEHKMENILEEVYRKCKKQIKFTVYSKASELYINYVKAIYEPFTSSQITSRIIDMIKPNGYKIDFDIIFQTIDGLHHSIPDHTGDWYFTGNYPTPGGFKSCSRSYINWYEGNYKLRGYGLPTSFTTNGVLLLGSGDIEDLLSHKLTYSKDIGIVWVYPGNAGTDNIRSSGKPIKNAILTDSGHPPTEAEIIFFCKINCIQYIIINDNKFISENLFRNLKDAAIPYFGPSLSLIEKCSSKNIYDELNTITGLKVQGDSFYCTNGNTEAIAFASSPEYKHNQTSRDFSDDHGNSSAPNSNHISIALSILCDSNYNLTYLPTAAILNKQASPTETSKKFIGATFSPLNFSDTSYEAKLKSLLNKIFIALTSHIDHNPFCLTAYFIPEIDPILTGISCQLSHSHLLTSISLIKTDLNAFFQSCFDPSSNFNKAELEYHKFTCSSLHLKAHPCQIYSEIAGIKHAKEINSVSLFHNNISTSWSNDSPEQRISRSQKLFVTGEDVLTLIASGKKIQDTFAKLSVAARKINFKNCIYINLSTDPLVKSSNGQHFLININQHKTLIPNPLYPSLFNTLKHDTKGISHSLNNGFNSESDDKKHIKIYSPTSKTYSYFQPPASNCMTYLDSGVDRDAAFVALDGVQRMLGNNGLTTSYQNSATYSFTIDNSHAFDQEEFIVTVSGIGTKSKIAAAIGQCKNIGIDLVALVTNSIVASGGKPSFFIDHLSTSELDSSKIIDISRGIAEGCKEADCKYFVGEKAELPGLFLQNSDFDLCGFGFGKRICIPSKVENPTIRDGDLLLGLSSSGIHSNGFSLLRKLLESLGLTYDTPTPWNSSQSLGEAFLTPSKIYVKPLTHLQEMGLIKRCTLVTSGGLSGALNQIIPQELCASIPYDSWDLLPVFQWLLSEGHIDWTEMANTFNCGLGMLLVIAPENKNRVVDHLTFSGYESFCLSFLTHNSNCTIKYEFTGTDKTLCNYPTNIDSDEFKISSSIDSMSNDRYPFYIHRKTKTAIIVNTDSEEVLQGLMRASKDTEFPATVEIIIALLPNQNLFPSLNKIQGKTSIPIKHVFTHLSSSEIPHDWLPTLNNLLEFHNIEIICTLEYDFDFPIEFIKRWRGKILIPSLQPPVDELKNSQLIQKLISSSNSELGCWIFLLDIFPNSSSCLVTQGSVKINEMDSLKLARYKFSTQCVSKLYIEALQKLAEGIVEVKDSRLTFYKR